MVNDYWAVAFSKHGSPRQLWMDRQQTPRMFKTRKSAIVNARKYLCDGSVQFDLVKYVAMPEPGGF